MPAGWECARGSERARPAIPTPPPQRPRRELPPVAPRPGRSRRVKTAGAFALALLLASGRVGAHDPVVPPPPTPVSMPGDSAARDTMTVGATWRLVESATLIERGAASGRLVEPAGLAVDAFGRVWVADAALHRVVRLGPDGSALGQSGALGSAAGGLRRPGSVALLGTLSVAVLDRENRRVVLYDLNDRLQGTLIDFDAPVVRDVLGRIEPVSLAADRGGGLYVADSERDRVLAFDFSGRHTRTIGGFGAAAGSFRDLAAIAATRRGELVTVERAPRRLQRMDATGAPVAAWGFGDSLAGRGALALAVDDSLRTAVADERTGTVEVRDRDGAMIARLGGLDRPRALAFAPGGSLFIAEAGPGRLRRFRLESAEVVPPATER